MVWFFLFVLGLIFGSFLNVVALRYDGEHFLFDSRMIGGRSHCPECKKTLSWFELVPLVSFVVQKGKCRSCGFRIGFQYPAAELLAGIVFVAVPWRLMNILGVFGWAFWVIATLWIAAFLVLFLISYIDIRLGIIPDEAHIILGVVAFALVGLFSYYLGGSNQSFFGSYALLFGLQQNIWVSHVLGMIFGFAFFEFLVLVTRGRGMGLGDVKLALPLGFLFGWPDILFLVVIAFVIGAVVGVGSIMLRRKTMKGALPFGPFLATSAVFVFFFGFNVLQWYLKLMGI